MLVQKGMVWIPCFFACTTGSLVLAYQHLPNVVRTPQTYLLLLLLSDVIHLPLLSPPLWRLLIARRGVAEVLAAQQAEKIMVSKELLNSLELVRTFIVSFILSWTPQAGETHFFLRFLPPLPRRHVSYGKNVRSTQMLEVSIRSRSGAPSRK